MRMRYWAFTLLVAEALLLADNVWWDELALPLLFAMFAVLDYAQSKAHRRKAKCFYTCLECGLAYATVHPYKGHEPRCIRCQERMMLARLMRGGGA